MTALRHDVLVYDDDAQLVATAATFLAEGLAAGEAVVVVDRPRQSGLLRDALGDDARQVQWLDADDFYLRVPSTLAAYDTLARQAVRGGAPRLRAVAEIAVGPLTADRVTWTRYEAALNRALEHSPLWVMCGYDERVLPEVIVADALRTHPYAWYDGTRLAGERYVDPAELLREVFAGAELPGVPPTVALDGGARPAEVRRAVRDAAGQAGLTAESAEALLLAVHEVVANAGRHGRTPAHVDVWIRPSEVVCSVSDSGPGPDPLAAYLVPEPDADGGMGLWVAHHLTDEFGVAAGDGHPSVRLAVRG